MILPKTREEDYVILDREKKELAKKATSENMSLDDFKKKMIQLEKTYQGRVFPEDTYLFDNFKKFEDFIKNSGFCGQMRESLEHERAHGEKAEELGYTVSYGCSFMLANTALPEKLCLDTPIICYKTFFRIKEIVIPKNHAREIAQAPKRMSRTDKDLTRFISELE